MTSTEAICTAIVGGFTVLGAAIRLSVHALRGLVMRVVKAIDDSTEAWKETSGVVQTLVRDMTGLKEQLNIAGKVEAAVQEAVDEVSGVHEAAKAPERQTPTSGYMIVRPKRPRAI